MFVEGKIKALCKGIIVEYTHHVRDAVRQGRKEYIDTGINEDIQVYKALFMELLSISLGLNESESNINATVIQETVALLNTEIDNKKYKRLKGYKTLIYSTCELIFEKVIKELEEVQK